MYLYLRLCTHCHRYYCSHWSNKHFYCTVSDLQVSSSRKLQV